MKIFRNLALALLSVSLISPVAAFAGKNKAKVNAPVPVPTYARVIVDTQDYAWPVGFPVDPNHTFMVASGVHTQAEADQLDIDAAAEFLALYGVDFNPVTNPNVVVTQATGIRTIPGFPATWFPYYSENQAFVVSDSLYPKRGKGPDGEGQDWVNNKYGIQILFNGPTEGNPPVQFTGGENVGAYYRANNLFSYGYFNYMRFDALTGKPYKPNKPKNREVITYTTTNLSYSAANQWNDGATSPASPYRQFTVTLKVIDGCGNAGKYIGTTEIYRLPLGASGSNFLRENPVSTWRTLEDGVQYKMPKAAIAAKKKAEQKKNK